MGHRLFEYDAWSPFGLLAFTPKRYSIWASTIYVLCKILLRVIGLHPKANTIIYGNDHALVLWNFIWPSILIGLRLLLVYLTRVHWSIYPSSSSEEGSHRRIASEYHLKKWSHDSRSWAALSTLWSQFLIFPSRKRPSAQSTEGIQRPSAQSAEGIQSPIVQNVEVMKSPFVRKPKTRAYLCELKSRRSPKRSLFVRKAEGMESSSAIMPKAS